MALKAGRVGVNPKYVDSEGKPIGSGGSSDAYTKAQADAKFATKTELSGKADASDVYTKTASDEKFATKTALEAKADQSNLTANTKDFVFAYSGGQYGYKAGSDGAFNPFEKAGVTIMGWVKPATLVSTDITVTGNKGTVVSGGYFDDEANSRYVIDVVIEMTDDLATGYSFLSFSKTISSSPNPNLFGNRGATTLADALANTSPAMLFKYDSSNHYYYPHENSLQNGKFVHVMGVAYYTT